MSWTTVSMVFCQVLEKKTKFNLIIVCFAISGSLEYIYLRFHFLRYTHDKQFDRALGIYLKLKHKDVFDLIHRHNLFDSISDKIVLLMEFDAEAAVKMLLDNKDKVPVCICIREVFYIFLY